MENTVKTITSFLGIFLALGCSVALGQQMPKPETARTVTQALDRAIANVEKEFVPAADAMPEDKYDDTPTDGELKGERTFAQQTKHTAVTNFEIAATIRHVK